MESDSARALLLQITESVRRYVESLQEGGVTGLPRAEAMGGEETEKRRNGEIRARQIVFCSPIPRFPDSPIPFSFRLSTSAAGAVECDACGCVPSWGPVPLAHGSDRADP